MKKVYIPTQEELYSLQNMGVNIYYYLLTKTIESILMADVIYEEEDMFDVAYDEFAEHPQIIYSIARMYPERIADSERASSDVNLCKKIIPTLTQSTLSLKGLDYMMMFKEEVLKHPEVIETILTSLATKLQNNPRYRFEYQGPNDALDEIFACETPVDKLTDSAIESIASIDPIYFVKLQENGSYETCLDEVKQAIIKRASMYGLNAFGVRYTKDIDMLTNPNERVKKLMRCLDRHKQYYQY